LIFGWLDIGVIFQVNMWLRLVNCWLIFGENVADVAEEHSTSAMVMGKMMMFRPELDTRKTGCVGQDQDCRKFVDPLGLKFSGMSTFLEPTGFQNGKKMFHRLIASKSSKILSMVQMIDPPKS
jgi:hypothetical protein